MPTLSLELFAIQGDDIEVDRETLGAPLTPGGSAQGDLAGLPVSLTLSDVSGYSVAGHVNVAGDSWQFAGEYQSSGADPWDWTASGFELETNGWLYHELHGETLVRFDPPSLFAEQGGAGSVPEPTTLGMLAAAVLLVVAWKLR